MRSQAQLVAAAQAAGMGVRSVGQLGDQVTGELTFDDADPWAAARLLDQLAHEDASDPVVVAWSLSILKATRDAMGERGPTLSPELVTAFGEALFANVQSEIAFVHEPGERFQSAATTMQLGAGDCDDHARLLLALALAGGLNARMLFIPDPDTGEPVHVVDQIEDGNGMWRWAETTIAAEYGEDPLVAVRRLQLAGGQNPLAHAPAAMGDVGALDFATPGDVVAYRTLWDPYVMGVARAIDTCASSQTDPVVAQALQADASAIAELWNLYAGWSDDEVLVDAYNILKSYQHTVMLVGTRFVGQLQLYCPTATLPPIPSADAQTDLIARLEGLEIVAHGVLQLIGTGAGGVLEMFGSIAKPPAPATLDLVKSLSYAVVAAAVAYTAGQVFTTVRAFRGAR